jgi:pyruvate dehydrogenase E1 component
MPQGAKDGILRGMYRLPGRDADGRADRPRVQLLGSGPILREVLQARAILAERFGVASDVWSVTSYKELRREALAAERFNRLHPTEEPRRSYLERTLQGIQGPFVAASDYMRLVCEQIARWVPGRMTVLGTDGFGRSDTREALRRHFEVDAAQIVYAALFALVEQGDLERGLLPRALEQLEIDPGQIDPVVA